LEKLQPLMAIIAKRVGGTIAAVIDEFSGRVGEIAVIVGEFS